MESKAKNSQLESNMALENDIARQKSKQLENLLAIANKHLQESREQLSKKEQAVNDLEKKLNTQLTRQKEVEKKVENLVSLMAQIACLEFKVHLFILRSGRGRCNSSPYICSSGRSRYN